MPKRKGTLKRWLLIAAGALALAALIFLALRPAPVLVELAPIERGPFAATVTEEGQTRVRDRFVVSAPASGSLERLEAEVGDEVERGDVLVSVRPAAPAPLDPRTAAELEQRLAAAQAAVSQARASSAFAQGELERQRALAERGAVARRDLEQAQVQAEAAAQQVEEAKAVASAIRAQLGVGEAGGAPLPVRAPASGRILVVHQESEGVVMAGAPLLEIGDAGALEVVTDVLSEDAVAIAPGAAVTIDRWGGERALSGVVRLVEPYAFTKVSALGVEEQRVNVIIDLLDDPGAYPRLGDGYRVVSHVVTFAADDALLIPLGALFRTGESWSAFVVREGRARAQPVQIGKRGDTHAQLLGGLDEGDEVVLYPGDRLEDGALVEQR